jgi:hypothetical protein
MLGISQPMAFVIASQAGLSNVQAAALIERIGPVAHYDGQPFYLANSISHAIQRMKRRRK